MKSAHNSQKGLAPIVIIIILAIVGVGGFLLYSNSKSTPTSPSSSTNITETKPQTDQNEIPGLTKIDGSNYIFYYPQDYMKLDKKLSSNTALYYAVEAKKDTKEGVALQIESLSERNDTPSSEFCSFALKFLLRSTKNVRVVEAKPVDYIKSHGCDLRYVDDNVPGKLVYHEKQLWNKEGDDLNVYTVVASYLTTEPYDKQDLVDKAVNNFTLK